MKSLLAIASIIIWSSAVKAQTDTTAILNQLESKLNSSSISVSSVLTDKNYLSLHPYTSFRELIKKYSSDKALTIITADEPGKKIKVLCTVINEAGQTVPTALVYVYQTDSRGWYAADAPHVQMNEGDMRHARLFGYVKTNDQGQFELHTIKPSGYPKSDLPAHIHVHVAAKGYHSFVNEFLFDDDERLVGHIRTHAERNHFIISKPEKTTAPFEQQFSYTIILAKD